MQIGDYTITGQTTRDYLIEIMQSQQQEIERLEDQVECLQVENSSLALAPAQRARLADVADLLADQGKIFNTPQANADWTAGLTARTGYAQ